MRESVCVWGEEEECVRGIGEKGEVGGGRKDTKEKCACERVCM